VLWGSLLLLVALVPTGLAILRIAERVLGHRFALSVPERVLIAFYAVGAAFFVLASIPLAIYGTPLILGVLGTGAVVYGAFAVRERGKGLLLAGRQVVSGAGFLLGAGTLGLLIFEIAPVWNHPFPNAWDGSVTALWTNLTLSRGTLPTTLEPFASSPVVYPLATTVWMTLPVRLLNWPIVQTPVLLPPLFLSLTVPAAFCWGTRWSASPSTSGTPAGLLFAGFFGLVASWPRFYTGGSYDFAFALPLFLVALGLLPSLVQSEHHLGAEIVAFGLLAGMLTSLSVAAGEALLVLLVVYAVTSHRKDAHVVAAWVGRTAIVAGFEAAFSLRSVTAWLVQGQPAYGPSGEYGSLNARLVDGELDPLSPWKYKVSPFPWLTLELQILLVIGVVLAIWAVRNRPDHKVQPSSSRLASHLLVGAVAMFALTGFLLIVALPGPLSQGLLSVTNLDQTSILLFVFLEGLCLFPLLVALRALIESATPTTPRVPELFATARLTRGSSMRDRPPGRLWSIAGMAAVIVLVVPFCSGAWFTVTQGPGFIEQNVGKTSNVTAADVAVMEWIGVHLPACSSVLVAPGSAGQFLPEYATVHVVFPMNPEPRSPAYWTAVSNLTTGNYTSATRAALENLNVTEVFVTGETSVSYLPFLVNPLLGSADFSSLVGSGDALVLSFGPGVSQSHCMP